MFCFSQLIIPFGAPHEQINKKIDVSQNCNLQKVQIQFMKLHFKTWTEQTTLLLSLNSTNP